MKKFILIVVAVLTATLGLAVAGAQPAAAVEPHLCRKGLNPTFFPCEVIITYGNDNTPRSGLWPVDDTIYDCEETDTGTDIFDCDEEAEADDVVASYTGDPVDQILVTWDLPVCATRTPNPCTIDQIRVDAAIGTYPAYTVYPGTNNTWVTIDVQGGEYYIPHVILRFSAPSILPQRLYTSECGQAVFVG